jgi:ABC-type multidrug transport system fused ATPase/permease subunit
MSLSYSVFNPICRTDKLIQSTIRAKFSQTTVLTVAHRLNTILDSDRVMLLDSGSILEFDSPSNLYNRDGGKFRKLVEEAGLESEIKKLK